ncbi:MAG: hypothetical protein IT308_10715 [Anaerolineaceae bacterium]|nr:hypothetical protein [Anaerolineaceae bacterium]
MPHKALSNSSVPQKIKIPAIQHAVKVVQTRLASFCASQTPVDDTHVEILFKEIKLSVEKIKRQIHDKGLTRERLTTGDSNAYRWLNFLCIRENLTNHIASLSAVTQQAFVLTSPPHSLPGSRRPSVSIRFYSTTYLYKATHRQGQVKILINEAFIGAPAALLAGMVYLMLKDRDPKKLAAIRNYARQPAFTQNYESLYSRRSHIKPPGGGHYHLLDIFERVNNQYFDGKIPPPRLGWSSRRSRSKFGHYQMETDTIVVNRALDAPHIPEYVVDFVMYHELLHKQIGVKHQNGRRQVHTIVFRTAEKQFKFYKEALSFIENFIQTS